MTDPLILLCFRFCESTSDPAFEPAVAPPAPGYALSDPPKP